MGSQGLVKLLRDLVGHMWEQQSRTGKGLCTSAWVGSR